MSAVYGSTQVKAFKDTTGGPCPRAVRWTKDAGYSKSISTGGIAGRVKMRALYYAIKETITKVGIWERLSGVYFALCWGNHLDMRLSCVSKDKETHTEALSKLVEVRGRVMANKNTRYFKVLDQ